LALGVFAIVNGTLHLIHVTDGGVSGSDLTGVLALAAGVVLTLLGLAIPFVHRGEATRTRARRWVNRVVAVLAGALALYALVVPTSLAIFQTHKYREPIGSPPSGAYRDVSFASSDGLQLSGWYRPSRNRAAIVVVHGGGGDRTGAVAHAEIVSTRANVPSSIGQSWIALARFSSASVAASRLRCCSKASSDGRSRTGAYACAYSSRANASSSRFASDTTVQPGHERPRRDPQSPLTWETSEDALGQRAQALPVVVQLRHRGLSLVNAAG
jgi:hypothetical protein